MRNRIPVLTTALFLGAFTITKIQSPTTSLAAGQSGSATATCPAGSQVIGGGQNDGYNGSLALDTNAPNTTTSWTIHATRESRSALMSAAFASTNSSRIVQ